MVRPEWELEVYQGAEGRVAGLTCMPVAWDPAHNQARVRTGTLPGSRGKSWRTYLYACSLRSRTWSGQSENWNSTREQREELQDWLNRAFSYLHHHTATVYISVLRIRIKISLQDPDPYGQLRIRIEEVKKPRNYTGSVDEYRTGNIKVSILL